MKRQDERQLSTWLSAPRRKPLVLRGARQVGKSTLVRQFAEHQGLILNEVNLERHLRLEKVFASLDMALIRAEIEALVGRSITAPKSLLFLDEIQATPSALQALRYLYEDLPAVPVIAAGSLLEFALAAHGFSMPVGRIDYHHLGPMSFREFLEAIEPALCRYLDEVAPDVKLPESAHLKLLQRQRQYLFVGGMPEAVLALTETGSLEEAAAVHRRIVSTYEDDFAKYARQRELALFQHVFRQLPRQVGQKVKYVNFSREERARDVKAAIEHLVKARVCSRVCASTCSGVPLHADVDEAICKLLFLDIGLMNHMCGVDWLALSRMDDTHLVNEGAVAEQFIGQHLAYASAGAETPQVAYWLREGRAANAEVDYVVSRGPELFPVEVKAGSAGALRSLHQFVAQKKTRVAIRFDQNPPGRQHVEHLLSTANNDTHVRYDLISLPLYAVGELGRLLDALRAEKTSKK
jgi:predicted AAA+ superfamily ATPase